MSDAVLTLRAVAAILWCLAVGCGLVMPLARRLDGPTFLSSGLLVGIGAVSLELLFLDQLGVGWDVTVIVLVSSPVVVASALVAMRRAGEGELRQQAATLRSLPCRLANHPIELVVAGVLVALVLANTVTAQVIPTGPGRAYDAYNYYLLKARMFYMDGSVEPLLRQHSELGYTAPDYPILVSLAFVWLYTVAGGVDERLIPLLGASFVMVGAALCYGQARRIGVRSSVAAVLALLLVPHLMISLAGYTDGPLAVYLLLGSGFAALFLRDNRPEYAVLAAAGFGFAAWTKNEGIAICYGSVAALLAVIAYGLASCRRLLAPLAPSAVLGLVPILMILPWTQLQTQYGVDVVVLDGADQLLARLHERLLPSFVWLLLRAGLYWNALLLLALAVLAIGITRRVRIAHASSPAAPLVDARGYRGWLPDVPPSTLYLCLLLLSALAAFLLAMATSPDPLPQLLHTATPRLIIQITTIFFVLLADLLTVAPAAFARADLKARSSVERDVRYAGGLPEIGWPRAAGIES